MLDEKSTALEQLAARSQALDAAQLQIRELTAASKDRLALAADKEKVGGGRGGQGCLQTRRGQVRAGGKRFEHHAGQAERDIS